MFQMRFRTTEGTPSAIPEASMPSSFTWVSTGRRRHRKSSFSWFGGTQMCCMSKQHHFINEKTHSHVCHPGRTEPWKCCWVWRGGEKTTWTCKANSDITKGMFEGKSLTFKETCWVLDEKIDTTLMYDTTEATASSRLAWPSDRKQVAASSILTKTKKKCYFYWLSFMDACR